MLSTQYRLRMEAICKDIASGTEVSMEDMIWAQKLAKANTSARGMLNQARKQIKEDSMVQMTLQSGSRMIPDLMTGVKEIKY